MKKICIILIVAIIAITLCSCNMSVGLGNFNYTRIHIEMCDYSGCYTIEKWYENDSGVGVEVKTKELGNIFVSEGLYILVSDKCPICDKEN